ncbi:protein PELOTA 1 [Citrus sinensis]|nr:protein PELOTA 1 [Citrus sinensis]
MKILRRNLVENGPGSVKMEPVDSDDLWFAYNLIAPGDSVMAVTVRKVLRQMASGSRDAERVKLKLEIKVEVVDYDKEGSVLRIRGKNILENEHVKIGAFHTLEIELHRAFVLRKNFCNIDSGHFEEMSEISRELKFYLPHGENFLKTMAQIASPELSFPAAPSPWLCFAPGFVCQPHVQTEADCGSLWSSPQDLWDSLALDTLHQAADPTASADLAVVLMQEGLAHILLVGRSMTITRSRIETSIPRKHGPAIAGYESALNKFFENVLQAFLKHVDFNVVRCAVIASPGFTKDQFHRHLLLEAERRQLRPIIENKSRIILVHTSSGYKHSLREVLDAPNVMNMIKDTKAAQETLPDNWLHALSPRHWDPTRACYGPKHVEVAHERMAVQTLLITDDLFRWYKRSEVQILIIWTGKEFGLHHAWNSDIATRQKYVNLVTSVKDSGGTAHIFSSMHVSGEQLGQLTGIAAILRFPLPDLEDIEM